MLRFIVLHLLFLTLLATVFPIRARCESVTKTASVLNSAVRREAAIRNAERFDWARAARDNIVKQAEPWMKLSYDETWDLMFGPTITRSWMVWSDGFCPECEKDVRMYNWVIDIWDHPFKVKCPHCETFFPTNDFEKYYESGLDEAKVFDPALADRSLLFNEAHPDPTDPKHQFGVDDGEGYTEDGKRWRFVGYYLSSGQWRRKIVAGIDSLSEAYAVTGDKEYSRRSAILLDRIADLYPDFDFGTQGEVYEVRGSVNRGYVSVWHDACAEIQRMAYAYDQIFDGARDDPELIKFLAAKAEQTGSRNPKDSFLRIQENIEERIFRDTLAHEHKIQSNYPTTPVAVMTIKTVLGWPDNREDVLNLLCEIARTSTVEDGLTGEKGLFGYATIFPVLFADVIARYDALDSTLIDELFERYPALRQTWRFFIDTWCFETFYPRVGDCGSFGSARQNYVGANFHVPVRFSAPSTFSFMWRLFEITGDVDYIKVLYKANGYKTDNLPHDLGVDNPEAFQKRIQGIIDRVGEEILPGDVKFDQWGLSILRSGEGDRRRALWLVNDSSGNHGHMNALNLGLFAHGADLLPDFGYPPVGYGGWTAPKALWYRETAAHNTVIVDGARQQTDDGAFLLWCPGKDLDLVKATAPECAGVEVYQRTLLKVDIFEEDFYVIDLFQVVGGSEHAYFLSPNFGQVEASGFTRDEEMAVPFPDMTRSFKGQQSPAPGWSLDWTLEDRSKTRSEGASPLHLRYIGLTGDAEVSLGECWVDTSHAYSGREEWLPRLMVRRRSEIPGLRSDFLGILQPYDSGPFIESVSRSRLKGDGRREALEVNLADGRRQVLIYSPVSESTPEQEIDLPEIKTDAEFLFLSLRDDVPEHAGAYNGNKFKVGDRTIEIPDSYLEIPMTEK